MLRTIKFDEVMVTLRYYKNDRMIRCECGCDSFYAIEPHKVGCCYCGKLFETMRDLGK